MKNLIYLVLIAATIACEKNTENSTKEVLNLQNKSTTSGNGYSHQLPYVTALDEITGNEKVIEYTLTDSLLTSNEAWDFYDRWQSDTLSASLQQYIGYIVLQKKDLIGLASNNPIDVSYQQTLKKHISCLVDSKHNGYCLLYHALINVADEQYQAEQATKILKYALNDTFLDDIESNEDAPEYLKSVLKENYSYINNLEALANQ